MMKAFVLAGGFATRLWPLTEKRAKPLLPVAGKPILSHLVERIPQEIPVTVSTNAAFAEGFHRWKEKEPRQNIDVVVEETTHDDQKLGALGATAQWLERSEHDDDLLLLTGDNYLGFSMEDFLEHYQSPAALLAAYDLGDLSKASAFGTVITQNSKLKTRNSAPVIAFEEKPKQPRSSLVSTGCAVIPRQHLPVLIAYARSHPDNVGGIFEEFLRRGIPVEAFTFTEPWLDIGSFPAYLDAHRLLVSGSAHIHLEAKTDECVFEGSVAVGRGSTVRGSALKDTMIFEDCVIENCVLRDCIIDDRCTLRGVDLTGKMLREGTVLVA